MAICQSTYEIIDRKNGVVNDLLSEALESLGKHLESYNDINDAYNRCVQAGYTFEHQIDDNSRMVLHKIIVRQDGYLISIHGICVESDAIVSAKINCRW